MDIVSTPSHSQYLSISRRALDVEDYIDIVRRHASWILGPLFAGLVISCVVAFLLPNTYVSSAVLRIAPGQISEALVTPTLNQMMNDRLAQLQQQILSRDSLSELIQRPTLDLYRKERQTAPLQDVIDMMRARDIRINIFALGGSGRPSSGIQITFAYPDKYKAQAVVQALTTKFTDAMASIQVGAGKATTDFLKDEITQARAELNRLDSEITQFRIANAGHLPEELQVNLQALNGLQQQMGGVNDALSRISEDQLTLRTSLETLKTQRDAYANMVTTTLDGASRAQNERLGRLNYEITELESGLLRLQQRYTDTYPDIKDYRQQLALKRRERDDLQLKDEQDQLKAQKAPKRIITNPMAQERLVEIQGSIDQINTQLRNKETERLQRLKQLEDINKSISVYESRISQVPQNQQKYVALARDHELAQAHYADLQHRQATANIYDEVGKRKAGENLETLDTASLPETPAAPNRMLITGIGVGVGLGLGIFLTGVKEMKDTSLKNLKDVRAYTNLPILSSIPLLENDLIVRRNRRLAYLGWAAAIIVGIIAMSGSMYYHYYLNI